MNEIQKALSTMIFYAPEGQKITLSSGKETTWILDCMPLTFGDSSSVGFEVNNALANAGVLPGHYDAVGGPDLSGVPIAVASAMTGGHRAFAVRTKAPKGAQRLAGAVGAGDRVVLVDDVYTTGTTLHEAIKVCTTTGITVVAVLVLVYRGNVGVLGEPPRQMVMPVLGDSPEDQAATIPFIAMLLPPDIGVDPADAYVLDDDDAEA